MAANRKNELVAFQRRAATDDGLGNPGFGAWQTLFISAGNPTGGFHARLTPMRGREELLDQKLAGVQPFVLVVWYSASTTATVLTSDRCLNLRTGDVYDIIDKSNPDERRKEITMMLKAGKPANG